LVLSVIDRFMHAIQVQFMLVTASLSDLAISAPPCGEGDAGIEAITVKLLNLKTILKDFNRCFSPLVVQCDMALGM